jgi:hypothetical protein
MILPDLILPFTVNAKRKTFGMDTIERCKDLNHFNSYPYDIEYSYNSRGYRGDNWPDNLDDLKKSVWCIGDSFTSGVGNPLEHTWPYILEKQLKIKCINIGLDGASNNWIKRRAIDIINHVSPKLIVIQWSYINRRESDNSMLNDELRCLWTDDNSDDEDDITNTIDCINAVESSNKNTTIIHSFVPNFSGKVNINFNLPNNRNIKEVTQLDLARDGFHYGHQSAGQFVYKLLKLIDINSIS